MTAHDTGGRAGHIGEDPVVLAAVPPCRWLTRVARDHPDISLLMPEPHQIFLNAVESRFVAIKYRELDIGQFEYVRSLASWRGACIENALAITQVEQPRGLLRAQVLYCERALGKTGQ